VARHTRQQRRLGQHRLRRPDHQVWYVGGQHRPAVDRRPERREVARRPDVQTAEVFDRQPLEARQEDGRVVGGAVQLGGNGLGVVERPPSDRPRRQRAAAQQDGSPEQVSTCNI